MFRAYAFPIKVNLLDMFLITTRSRQDGPIRVLGLRLGLKMGSDQNPRSNRHETRFYACGTMQYAVGPRPRSNGPGMLPHTIAPLDSCPAPGMNQGWPVRHK